MTKVNPDDYTLRSPTQPTKPAPRQGVHFWLPQPYLLVTPAADGSENFQWLYLQDYDHEYAVDYSSTLAALNLDVQTQNGPLKSVGVKIDSSALVSKATTDAAGRPGTQLARCQRPQRQRPRRQRPGRHQPNIRKPLRCRPRRHQPTVGKYGHDLTDYPGLTLLDQWLRRRTKRSLSSTAIVQYLWAKAALHGSKTLPSKLHRRAVDRLKSAEQHPLLGEHRPLRAGEMIQRLAKSGRPRKSTAAKQRGA